MKNRMYWTNWFLISRASSRPKPPCPCLRSPAASSAPKNGNYQPPDEELTSSISKLHTQSRTAGMRSYCYNSPTRWCQSLGCSCRTARSTPGRSRSRSRNQRLPPTKGWPLIWKRSKAQSDRTVTGDYSGKRKQRKRKLVCNFVNLERLNWRIHFVNN